MVTVTFKIIVHYPDQLFTNALGNPVVSFCLLGGLWGMITHMWAVYLGIVDKPPILQGVAAAAAVVVAVFEYVFYWSVVLVLAVAVDRLRRKIRRRKDYQET